MEKLELNEEYIREHCKNCKNKYKNLCEIIITKIDDVTIAKCGYYNSEIIKKRKTRPAYFQNW